MTDYVVLDLETTGFSPYANEIIQIGAHKIKDGISVDKFVTYVKPIQYIPTEVQSLTHITPEMVSTYPSIDEVLPEFFNFCSDLPFLGHNLSFDYDFLVVKGKECGVDFSLGGTRQGIDTLSLARKFFPKMKSHKLEHLVEEFGINLGNRKFHDAEFDAYATKLVYDRFVYNPYTVRSAEMPVLLTKNKGQYGKVACDDTLSFE